MTRARQIVRGMIDLWDDLPLWRDEPNEGRRRLIQTVSVAAAIAAGGAFLFERDKIEERARIETLLQENGFARLPEIQTENGAIIASSGSLFLEPFPTIDVSPDFKKEFHAPRTAEIVNGAFSNLDKGAYAGWNRVTFDGLDEGIVALPRDADAWEVYVRAAGKYRVEVNFTNIPFVEVSNPTVLSFDVVLQTQINNADISNNSNNQNQPESKIPQNNASESNLQSIHKQNNSSSSKNVVSSSVAIESSAALFSSPLIDIVLIRKPGFLNLQPLMSVSASRRQLFSLGRG